MKKFKQFLTASLILSTVASILFATHFFCFIHTPLSVKPEGQTVVIVPGTSVYKIAEQLVNEGLIESPWYLLFLIKKEGAWRMLQAGEYWIKPGTTPTELIALFSSGKVVQHAITIVPGWNFNQVMQALHQSPYLKHTLTEATPEAVMLAIGYPNEHPEGRFLPDTYYFPAGISDVQFLKRPHEMLKIKLALLWQARAIDLPLKSPDEALTLASIVEKESNVIDEYEEIAGVYIRRLEKKMRLQADPTVIYGAGKLFSGQVTRQMLLTPNPYNTYTQQGLPPTPIAMPSAEALAAVMHPKSGNTLYFVLHTTGKGHVFSKDLATHQVAVQKYRASRVEKQKKVGA
jgi:UPF0755 protein